MLKPEAAKRNDQTVTTVMTKTTPLQRSRRVDDKKLTSPSPDILSHLRILHIKAVSRNLIFSTTRATETLT